MTRLLLPERDRVLALLLFALMASHVANGAWGGDFWNYAACVRELAARPLAPHNPFLALDVPHQFFSPYALAVALVARVAHTDPIATLAVAGLVNLTLFLVAFRQFVIALTASRAPAFYALLFTLVLWGPGLVGTGFLKLNSIGFVLPYASTFATALMYGAFTVQLRRPSPRRALLVLTPLVTIVLLTHSPTAVAMIIGLFALAASAPHAPLAHLRTTFTAVFMGGAAVLLWPYYSLYGLATSFADAYHFGNRFVYGLHPGAAFGTGHAIAGGTMLRDLLPALVGVPLIFRRLRENRRDPLVLMLLGLLASYVYGAVSRDWTFGRVLPTLVAVLHIATADWLARLESRPAASRSRSALAYAGVVAIACVAAAAPMLAEARDYLPGRRFPFTAPADGYRFLAEHVGQDDVVVACPSSSSLVAAVAGKLMAAGSRDVPLAFVVDDDRRRTDLQILLQSRTRLARRQEILDRYDVRFFLIEAPPAGCMPLKAVQDFHTLGDVVARAGNVELMRRR